MATNTLSLKQCIEELSAKNTDYKFPEQAINQAESLTSLSSDLYTDNIRFIYELIQNADDAQAKNITLTILGDSFFIITHDGDPFTEKDLQGLCGINNGTKKKKPDKTGYKGLGFKAVFGKSDFVIIYSDGEYFRFDASHKIKWNQQWETKDQQTWERENDRKFIYPWQINPVWTNENEIPGFIRNFFNQKKKETRVAYAIRLNNVGEIHSALTQLKQQPYMFLFLRNITQMTFSTESNDITCISIARQSSHGLKQIDINKKIDSKWLIKRFELNVRDDIRKKLMIDTKAPEKLRSLEKAELFFAARYKEENEVLTGIERLRDQDSILFSYLPTKILEYKFPFLINANFLTNVNREQIHTDSPWNQWLFEKIGSEIFQWIKELVKDKKYRFQAYRLIPSKLNLTNNILSKRFDDSLTTTLQDCSFILNRKNQLLKVNEVIMDSTSLSKESSFIDLDSMRQYIANNNSQFAKYPFIDYDSNLKKIGVREFTWAQCVEMFQSEIFLRTHSVEHNKRMIEYFYSKCPTGGVIPGAEIDIEEIPFLLDQNNRLQLIKNIYFPAETIGDSGTSDSDDLFVNKMIFDWLNETSQKGTKQWLQNLGVEERTDLTFLRKTIIPNASTYSTKENTMKTIQMLFLLFQKGDIEKKELNELKKLKLLTTRGTLIPADQCYFSDQYKPRVALEDYLKAKEEKFLSIDYVTTRKENEDLAEWRRFFSMFGVQEDLYPIVFNRKLTSFEAAGYGFDDQYLLTTSPDEKHRVDAFSGLTTITFMQYTQNNYDFAKFFWSEVIKNINAEVLTQKIRVYWGHSDKLGATHGTSIEDGSYIHWFVKNIKCIPTTNNTCELSSHVFVDTKDLTDLCGKYMCFPSISLPPDKTNWHSIFNFKTKLSGNDYFDLLEKIRDDERNLKENLHRIQTIYHHILKEIYYWTSDEQKALKARAKSLYLLTENDQWKLASDLYLYMEGNSTNNNLNDAIPCLKLDYRNRIHSHLDRFLELFHIRQIRMNDLTLADTQSSSAEHFRQKLIDISPFLKNWLRKSLVSSEVISTIDKKIQQENDFIESDRLQLFYHLKLVGETNVYFDNKHRQLYVRRPWDSETTFIDLPNKLCLLLNIPGFEKNIRFLIKGTIEEIKQHFRTNSIQIPTKEDIVILEPMVKSKPSAISTPEPPPITNSKISKSNKEPLLVFQPPYQVPFHGNDIVSIDSTLVPIQDPRQSTCVFIGSEDEQYNQMELFDISTIIPSDSIPFDGIPDGESSDTGRIGEAMVYRYLLNEHRNHPPTVTIKWLNEKMESQLPYDIRLTKNGRTSYIEVKSTRTRDQHTFPLSINQIETFLQQKENYFIYRVYIDENKIIILDNIRWRLIQKQQLTCLLEILPISSD